MRCTAAHGGFSLRAATLLSTSLLFVSGVASVLGDSLIPTTTDAPTSEMAITASGTWTWDGSRKLAGLQVRSGDPDDSGNAAEDVFFVGSPFPGASGGDQPGASPTPLRTAGPVTPAIATQPGSVEAGVGGAGSATHSPGEGYITTFQQQVPSATAVILILLIGIAASVVIKMLGKDSAGRP